MNYYLDISSGIESVQLVDKLQHSSLHFIVSARAIVKSGTTNGVNSKSSRTILAP
jgi:hypothetical protein